MTLGRPDSFRLHWDDEEGGPRPFLSLTKQQGQQLLEDREDLSMK